MRSARILAVGGLVASAVVTGCAGVPDSGPVHLGQQVQAAGGLEDNDIRVLAPPPLPGMSPRAVVTGFLRAMIDSSDDYAVARSYLAARRSWNPGAGITTYDDTAVSVRRSSATSVDIHAPRVGTIDARGSYRVDPGVLARRLTLVRQAGQWRISSPPPGVLLSTIDTTRSLQPADVYYLDRSAQRVVPEQVLVQPEQPGLATTLVRILLAGPGGELAGSARTGFPTGTQLLGNVPVDTNGVAEVNLSGAVRQLPPAALRALSAQVDWTLRQLSNVRSVQLLADGLSLGVPGVSSPQPVGSWQSFDPDARPTSPVALVGRGDRIAAVDGTVPMGLTAAGLRQPASSPGGQLVAALRSHGRKTQLLLGPVTGPLRTRLSAMSVSAPSWVGADAVVVAVRRPAAASILAIATTGRPRPVSVAASLLRGGIQQLAVSPDGTRVAMVVGPTGRSRLLVAPLRATRRSFAIGPANLALAIGHADSGVAWAGAEQLVTTVAQGDRRVVVQTDPDGYQPEVLGHDGLPRRPTQVAAAPDAPLLAATSAGVWAADTDGSWRNVTDGDHPSYVG